MTFFLDFKKILDPKLDRLRILGRVHGAFVPRCTAMIFELPIDKYVVLQIIFVGAFGATCITRASINCPLAVMATCFCVFFVFIAVYASGYVGLITCGSIILIWYVVSFVRSSVV